MADIAQATGLLKGSLYHYFPSKEAMLVKVLEHVSHYFEEHVFSIAADGAKPPPERLRIMTTFIERYFKQHGACVMAHIALDISGEQSELQEMIRTFFRAWSDAFASVLAPRYGRKRAKELAMDAVADIEGSALWLRVFNDQAPLHRACKRVKALLD